MRRQQQGFTIVELLIAMAIFSIMSVILSSGIIRLFALYQSGASIRLSQQAARTIAEQVTRDAQGADVIVAGPDPSFTGRYNTLCFLTTQTTTTTTETLSGPEYFVVDDSGGNYALTDQNDLWQMKVREKATTASQTPAQIQAQLESQCTPPGQTQQAQRVSPSDTSVITFGGSDVSGSLLSGVLSVASNNALADIVSANLTSGATCTPSTTSICAVTNLNLTAGPLGGGQ
jgi:prepilin-type N-terminal cleavage/methylation domain-containing protein